MVFLGNVVLKGKSKSSAMRENDVPMLGVCLGMQLTCIEFARNVLGLEGATLQSQKQNTLSLISCDQTMLRIWGIFVWGFYPSKLERGSTSSSCLSTIKKWCKLSVVTAMSLPMPSVAV